jgi:hypothetical protein
MNLYFNEGRALDLLKIVILKKRVVDETELRRKVMRLWVQKNKCLCSIRVGIRDRPNELIEEVIEYAKHRLLRVEKFYA